MTLTNNDKNYLKWAAQKTRERKKPGMLCEVVGCSNLAEVLLSIPHPIDMSKKEDLTKYPDLMEVLIRNPNDPEFSFVTFWVCKKHHREDVWARMNYDRPIDMTLKHGEYEVHHWKIGRNRSGDK
jgi:hypothetical protein